MFVIDYMICWNTHPNNLATDVYERMKEGWVPFGGVASARWVSEAHTHEQFGNEMGLDQTGTFADKVGATIYQAMVKYGERLPR